MSAEDTLKRCRSALAEGRLSEARGLLDELVHQYRERLAGLAPPLASAEAYGIPESVRVLMQDRIDLVNA